jgi:hypothetical protein
MMAVDQFRPQLTLFAVVHEFELERFELSRASFHSGLWRTGFAQLNVPWPTRPSVSHRRQLQPSLSV